jgi:hypothetical protein
MSSASSRIPSISSGGAAMIAIFKTEVAVRRVLHFCTPEVQFMQYPAGDAAVIGQSLARLHLPRLYECLAGYFTSTALKYWFPVKCTEPEPEA